jgi:PBP1b-binding outer membrane lipoprotein LpoB
MKKFLSIILIAVVLSSCATYQYQQPCPPTYKGTSKKRTKYISTEKNCLTYKRNSN